MNFIKTLLRAVWAGSVISTLVVVSFAQKAAGALVHDAQGPAPYQAHIDLAAPFESVGVISHFDSDGTQAWASGILIAPNKVLTAAHVVIDAGGPGYGFQFVVGADIFGGATETVNAISYRVHPEYYGIGGPADLAVLTLERRVTSVSPVKVFLGDYALQTEVVMVGYGRPGTVSEGYQDEFDGIRRAGVMIPSEYGGGVWPQDYLAAWFLQVGWPYSHELGQMATPGDSGGGWFINNNGTWELVGVTAINSTFYGYGGRTGALRLDDYNGYREWVLRQIRKPHVIHHAAPSGTAVTPVEVKRYP